MKTSSEDFTFARWLNEWATFLESEKWDSENPQEEEPELEADEFSDAARDKIRQLIRPFDSQKPVPSEIRLVSSTVIPGERPVWVAVLEGEKEQLLVAPFSRFSVPATPYELDTPHGVLNLWQAAWIDEGTLKHSWVAREMRLSGEDLRDALLVLDAYRSYQHTPNPLKDRTGARLSRHKTDPRHAYMAQEQALLSPLNGRNVERGIHAHSHGAKIIPLTDIFKNQLEQNPALRLAADDSRSRIAPGTFRVPKLAVLIRFSFDPVAKSIRWNVFDEHDRFSDHLKGFSLVSARTGKLLCEIEGASGTFTEIPPEGILLIHPDGTAVDLVLTSPDRQ